MTSSPRINRATAVWTFIGLVLLTVNLRAAITGISPMLGDLREVFGLSGIEVSVLTTLPVLCLGLFATLAPVLARRLGAEPAIAVSLLLITAGIVLRVVPARAALFAGTVLAGAGIAMGNVLMPAVIKRVFPRRVGSLTGMAMMLMATSGAIAAGLAVPMNDTAGWRWALAIWAVPSLVAALAWGPLAVGGHRRTRAASDGPSGATASAPADQGSLLRSPLAWHITAFMGLAALMFYVLMSWLPQIMRDHGQPPATAGSMVSVMMIIGIPLGFFVPVLAARVRDQRPLVTAITVIMAAGLAGLLMFPGAAWVWVAVLGTATGSAFPLGFTLLSLRSPSPTVAARLSGMAQCGGYLLAGLGPLAVGVLHSATGGWQVSLGLLLALVVPELVFGWLAARPGFVRLDPVPPKAVEHLIEPKNVPRAPTPERTAAL
ncbi:MFS transporter [Actinomadura vinacea]|uniref:MFS transporter n=1 Tax=Actinomadura vinacea TaxID=115336 RepID=A0ABN3JX38_9ACTN